MRIRFGVQNMRHNGWGAAIGDADPNADRLPLLIERLAPLELDLLVLNETRSRTRRRWPQTWQRRLHRLADALGLRIAGITPTKTRTPSALLYRARTMGHPIWWDTSLRTMFGHGYGVAAFTVPGLPLPMCAGAVHFTPFNIGVAEAEATTLVSRVYRKGSIGAFGGDFNFPLYGSDPNWDQALPHNIMLRAIVNGGANGALAETDIWLPDGTLNPAVDLQPNYKVADAIARGDCHDAAWELYKRTRSTGAPDETLLQATGAHTRVDAIAVTGALRPALTTYSVAATPPGASDHAAVTCMIDTERWNSQRKFLYR
ncbi:hypothetical protein [Glycomyces sp. MUSA5-2]|uniref:hypothetical protein n=1 Tax=Glycomyces sp. MUSA5-2 TaxID=2053002 RepID=UPI00300B5BF0